MPPTDPWVYWRKQLTERDVDPNEPWRDADVMVVVEELVKAHEADAVPRGEVERLRAALGDLKCYACGGSGRYKQKGAATDFEVIEVPCRTCGGTGIHPAARAALRGEPDATD